MQFRGLFSSRERSALRHAVHDGCVRARKQWFAIFNRRHFPFNPCFSCVRLPLFSEVSASQPSTKYVANLKSWSSQLGPCHFSTLIISTLFYLARFSLQNPPVPCMCWSSQGSPWKQTKQNPLHLQPDPTPDLPVWFSFDSQSLFVSLIASRCYTAVFLCGRNKKCSFEALWGSPCCQT